MLVSPHYIPDRPWNRAYLKSHDEDGPLVFFAADLLDFSFVRRLIINADDFGLTSGVNRAIAEANRSGVLTSATIMANAHAVIEAVSLAKSLASLHTGCHVVLIDGDPVSDNLHSLTNSSSRF